MDKEKQGAVEEAAAYRELLDRMTFSTFQLLLVIAVALVFWGVFYLKHCEGVVVIDAMDIAQEARNFSLGRGLTTHFIKPLSVMLQGNDVNLPDLYNSPLYIIILSYFFRLMGFTDEVVVGASLGWAFLSGILLLIFARWLFSLPFSMLIFLMYVGNLGVTECAFSGLHISFLSFVLLLFCLLFYLRERSSLFWTGGLGFLAGILYLSEFDFLFLGIILGVLTLMDSAGKRGLHTLVFGICALIAVSPWLVRNILVNGNPVSSLRWFDFKAYTSIFPGNRIIRDLNPAIFTVSLSPIVFIQKLSAFAGQMHRYWMSLSHSLLLPFFLASIMVRSGNNRWERVKVVILFLFFTELLLLAAGNGDLARILMFMPLITLSGMVVFDFMLQKLHFNREKFRRWIIGLFCLAYFYPAFIGMIFGLPSQRYVSPIFDRAEAEFIQKRESLDKIRSLIKSDEVVVSDVPWAVAWYANRNCIWLPWEIEQMRVLKEKFNNIRFLYLTPILFKYPPAENMSSWQSIYRSGMVPEWLQVDRGLLLPGQELIMGDIIFERLDLE